MICRQRKEEAVKNNNNAMKIKIYNDDNDDGNLQEPMAGSPCLTTFPLFIVLNLDQSI